MKHFVVLALVSAVVALPQGTAPAQGMNSLLNALGGFLAATDAASSISNDLVNGTSCKDVILIVARGSMEPGNMGKYLCTPLLNFQSQGRKM
jgi:hypothetical protein